MKYLIFICNTFTYPSRYHQRYYTEPYYAFVVFTVLTQH